MQQILSHLFIPHTSNNQRAKVLHHSSIFFLIIAFFLGQALFSYLSTDYPAVLGSSIDVSMQELLDVTNQKRKEQNVAPLELNEPLSKAAAMKADYMFEKNFWAHNSPEGTTPWYFIKKVGYEYTYAGENLARGFTESADVMDAWMNSPTHKENILSPNYTDIGFAIKKGRLLGEDTTLIVEMFGNTGSTPLEKTSEETNVMPNPNQQVLPAVSDVESAYIPTTYTVKTTSLLNSTLLSSSLAFFFLASFIFVLFLDLLIIQRKKIIRGVGHNMDHIFFFAAVVIIVIFSTKGLIV